MFDVSESQESESMTEPAQTIETPTTVQKVVVQQVNRDLSTSETTEETQRTNVVNGQQPTQSTSEQNQSNKFVLTPDYIQQSKFGIETFWKVLLLSN